MYISIEQALDAYDELLEAKNGTNSFGGTIAQIYLFRLMPAHSMYDEGIYFDEDNRMMEKKLAEDFHTLCYLFTKKHKVDIKINEVDLHKWIEGIRAEEFRFYNKVHVEVTKK